MRERPAQFTHRASQPSILTSRTEATCKFHPQIQYTNIIDSTLLSSSLQCSVESVKRHRRTHFQKRTPICPMGTESCGQQCAKRIMNALRATSRHEHGHYPTQCAIFSFIAINIRHNLLHAPNRYSAIRLISQPSDMTDVPHAQKQEQEHLM